MARKLKAFEWIAMVLVLVGAIAWGGISVGFNLVELLTNGFNIVTRIIYGMVGLSGIYLLFTMWSMRKK
ncbi:MAG: DUF378 domain-containing protein [bacterium]|nr:DUF378 domain-containing protein [bacterium]